MGKIPKNYPENHIKNYSNRRWRFIRWAYRVVAVGISRGVSVVLIWMKRNMAWFGFCHLARNQFLLIDDNFCQSFQNWIIKKSLLTSPTWIFQHSKVFVVRLTIIFMYVYQFRIPTSLYSRLAFFILEINHWRIIERFILAVLNCVWYWRRLFCWFLRRLDARLSCKFISSKHKIN